MISQKKKAIFVYLRFTDPNTKKTLTIKNDVSVSM